MAEQLCAAPVPRRETDDPGIGLRGRHCAAAKSGRYWFNALLAFRQQSERMSHRNGKSIGL